VSHHSPYSALESIMPMDWLRKICCKHETSIAVETHTAFIWNIASMVLTKSYTTPPTLDITLEEFETFAINRLRILSYIESLQHRSLPYTQLQTQLSAYLKQYLPLSSNTARSVDLVAERRGDEIGHWVLRLAFCRSYVPLPSFLSFF
jgi:hypothetical protein